jgi:dipeptidyl aminopeptidase/acylaminoacyl peptidase
MTTPASPRTGVEAPDHMLPSHLSSFPRAVLGAALGALVAWGIGGIAGAAEPLEAQSQAVPRAPSAVEAPVAVFEPAPARDHAFSLTLHEIMRGNEIVGQGPVAVSWSDDSRWIYFRWLPAGHDFDADRELWRVPAEGGEPELIDDPVVADSLSLTFADGSLSPDRRLRATAWRGDLYLVDRQSLRVRRLTDTRATVTSPTFSADGEHVFFNQGGQIHSIRISDGSLRQLTDVRAEDAPEEEEPEGHRAFLEEQQEELFEHIRRRKAREAAREEEEDRLKERAIRTVYIGEGRELSGLVVDPHGRHAAAQVSVPARGTELVVVPRWITDDGYTAGDEIRTKVGDAVGSSLVGIHPLDSDTILWPDVEGRIRAFAEEVAPVGPFLPEQRTAVAEGGVTPRTVVFRGWNDAGTHALISAVSDDNKHRWLLSVEAATGDVTVLEHLADSAWVAGPCFNCMGWLPDSDRVYYVSEADRFAHLYTVVADGSDRRQLTSGSWEVHSVEIPEQRDHFILRTNEGSPYDQHMYRMGLDGSERTRLTSGQGHFNGTVSPDGARMALVHSRITRPPELFVASSEPGAEMVPVTVSPEEDWLAFPWIDAEIVEFEARDGTMVPARIYRPSDLGAESNGAAVLFVHGAGYLQNVHRWWSSYFREYMFHHFLAAQGFTVLDVDYRASAGYGRDWRTAIYRHMGGWDLWDYVDGVQWLAENEGVDPGRIGIYGGSYGGFLTLMALFTEPDVFQAGAALRSVTDWAHYNEGYTSRILNRPQDDPEAYRQSSPIYFAEQFEGHLLMGHPMYDTNVHFSDIVRLTQRLIELGKENWELSVYPTENHGMVEPWSWVDQYRRIYELFWRTLSAPGCTEGTGVCELPVFATP